MDQDGGAVRGKGGVEAVDVAQIRMDKSPESAVIRRLLVIFRRAVLML